MDSPEIATILTEQPCRLGPCRGWTLTEILVAITVVALLAAAVVPIVITQVERAKTSAVVQDLLNVRTGIQAFQADVGAMTPRELEDLVNLVAEGEPDLYGTSYRGDQARRWRGPYLRRLIAEGTGDGDAFRTGFDARFRNRLVFYNSTVNAIASSAASADWIAVVIEGMSGEQFELINAYLEGNEPPGFEVGESWTSGFLRWDPGLVIDPGLELAPIYFLAVPAY